MGILSLTIVYDSQQWYISKWTNVKSGHIDTIVCLDVAVLLILLQGASHAVRVVKLSMIDRPKLSPKRARAHVSIFFTRKFKIKLI